MTFAMTITVVLARGARHFGLCFHCVLQTDRVPFWLFLQVSQCIESLLMQSYSAS